MKLKILIIDFTVDREQGIDFRNVLEKNLSDYFASIEVLRPEDISNDLHPDAIILSGAARPIENDFPWSKQVEEFLKLSVYNKTPILGICYGFQLMAKIFGGKAKKSNRPEVGAIKVRKVDSSSWLMKDLKTHTFYSYHFDEVLTPFKINGEEVKVVASTDRCKFQAYEFSKLPVGGFQFHPEKPQSSVLRQMEKAKGKDYLYTEGEVDEVARVQVFRNFLNRAIDARKG